MNEVAAGRVVPERGNVRAHRIVVAVDGRLDLLLPQLRDRVRSARLKMLATSPGTPAHPGRWSRRSPWCTVVDEGVVACGGYNGTGNLVGPLAARAAAALVADGTPPPAYFAG